MTVDDPIQVEPDLAGIVRPAWLALDRLTIVDSDPRLDEPLRAAAAAMHAGGDDLTATVAAVRTMYKRTGVDPTKTRPSSEALLRRVRKGGELPRINSAVDVVNWCSMESQLPFGLYDVDRLHGPVTLRLGRPGEEYPGIRKDVVHLAGRMTLADDGGPFGNPTSDSARAMVTTTTTGVFVVLFVPAALPGHTGERARVTTHDRLLAFCRR